MNDIINNLERMAEDIRYDLKAEWNDNKHLESVQLMKIESALALLKSVGDNRNISE